MSGELAGKVAVVTGAAGGIGRGICKAAAANGMRLVVADLAELQLREFAEGLSEQGHEVLAVKTDVSDPGSLDELADAAFAHFGAVNLLVNNAGVEALGNVWELSAEQLSTVIGVNIEGPMQSVRSFAGRMIAAGEPAHIANVASIAAFAMMPLQTPYVASKHAILAYSECLALEMARAAPWIKVSVVIPGAVNTHIFKNAPGTEDELVKYHRAAMNAMVTDHGICPDLAGRLILKQIMDGKFWVMTDPEVTLGAAAERARHLTDLGYPEMPARLAELYD